MVSVFVKLATQVRDRYDPFVSERWNATKMLSTSPTSADDWFTKGRPCAIMSVDNACKRYLAICHKSMRAGHRAC